MVRSSQFKFARSPLLTGGKLRSVNMAAPVTIVYTSLALSFEEIWGAKLNNTVATKVNE